MQVPKMVLMRHNLLIFSLPWSAQHLMANCVGLLYLWVRWHLSHPICTRDLSRLILLYSQLYKSHIESDISTNQDKDVSMAREICIWLYKEFECHLCEMSTREDVSFSINVTLCDNMMTYNDDRDYIRSRNYHDYGKSLDNHKNQSNLNCLHCLAWWSYHSIAVYSSYF